MWVRTSLIFLFPIAIFITSIGINTTSDQCNTTETGGINALLMIGTGVLEMRKQALTNALRQPAR